MNAAQQSMDSFASPMDMIRPGLDLRFHAPNVQRFRAPAQALSTLYELHQP